jgi:RNA polymerase sigma factor (sigma-70 family)
MKKIEELVKQYKKTKDRKISNQVFVLLDKILRDKAHYVYTKKNFSKNNSCGRGILTLKMLNRFDEDDVLQELRIEVLQLIENYDTKKSFAGYFYSTLWSWTPKELFHATSLFSRISERSLDASEIEEDKGWLKQLVIQPEIFNKIEIRDVFVGLTDEERAVVEIYLAIPEIKQVEVAEMLGITHQMVSLRLQTIKTKKINLQK